jgi:hypothetical protein
MIMTVLHTRVTSILLTGFRPQIDIGMPNLVWHLRLHACIHVLCCGSPDSGTSNSSSTLEHVCTSWRHQPKQHCNKPSMQAHQGFIAQRVAHPFNLHASHTFLQDTCSFGKVSWRVTLSSCACPSEFPWAFFLARLCHVVA